MDTLRNIVENLLREPIFAPTSTTPKDKISPSRFSLPISKQTALQYLQWAYSNEVARRGDSFDLDAPTVEKMNIVADYLTNPAAKPSLLLFGTLGNGKTTMARAIVSVCSCLRKDFGPEGIEARQKREQRYYDEQARRPFELALSRVPFPILIDAKEINQFAIEAPDNVTARNKFEALKTRGFLIIDDMGKEETFIYSKANRYTPIVDIIEAREKHILPTIITANLTEIEIGNKYGARILDRMIGQYEMVAYQNRSYRSR